MQKGRASEQRQVVVGKDHGPKSEALASISQSMSGARPTCEDDTRSTRRTAWTNQCDCATMELLRAARAALEEQAGQDVQAHLGGGIAAPLVGVQRLLHHRLS